jgi:hypothetical protein
MIPATPVTLVQANHLVLGAVEAVLAKLPDSTNAAIL